MVMLTQLMRYKIVGPDGRCARIADLCIALLDDDYPPVTHLLFHQGGKLRKKEWKNVSVDRDAGLIEVDELEGAEEHNDEKDVLLARDIFDALILDLLARRTTRVCDLELEEVDGTMRLVGAEAGFAAMIRRITRGRFGRVSKASLFDWKYVEFLRGDPSAADSGAGYRLRINRLPAGEVARLADYVPYLHAAELLNLLPNDKAADVLQAMPIDKQLQVIEELPEDEALDLLARMSPDLAADLIGRLHIETMRSYLTKLPQDRRDKILELLRYSENAVGGVMTNDIVTVPAGMTAGAARERVHEQISRYDFVSLVFLTDDEPKGRLRGSIPLRELPVADLAAMIADEMDPYLETLSPFESATQAARRIVAGQLEAMPVVDQEGRLLGAMTISSAISQLLPVTSDLRGVRVFS